MIRYRTRLIVAGQSHETYRDSEDASGAAWSAIRGWRSDANFRSATVRQGYTHYVFGGPRMSDVATVDVYDQN